MRSAFVRCLHLRDRQRHQFVHLGAELRFRDGDALGGEIGRHLATTRSPACLEIGGDDLLGIGVGGVAGHAELLRHPQPQQLVAAGLGLEFQLLVEREFLLETLFALVESGHGDGSDSRAEMVSAASLRPGRPMPR